MTPKLGIIGIVQEELKNDFVGTLGALRKLGYRGLEGGLGIIDQHGGPETFRTTMADAGMELISVFVGMDVLKNEFDKTADALNAADCKHAIIGWSNAGSQEDLQATADFFNETGPRLRDRGITLCYHNHEHEFLNTINQQSAMHKLLKMTEPEAFSLELDVAWAAFGGVNPTALLERYGDRIPLVHIKDLYDLSMRNCFAAPGTGLLDIKSCLEASERAGAGWVIVEQDQPRRIRGLDLATAAALNLRDLGLEVGE